MIRLSGIEKQFAGQRGVERGGAGDGRGQRHRPDRPLRQRQEYLAALREPAGATRCGPAGAGGSELDFAHHLSRQSVLSLRQQTGMVFQNFQLFPHMTVLENVLEGLVTVLKWPRERAAARACNCSTRWGSGTRPRRCLPPSPAVSSSGWPLPGRWRQPPGAAL